MAGPARLRSIRRYTASATLLAALFAALAVAACSPARVIESATVLGDLAAGAGPSRLKRTTPAPRRSALSYRVGARQYGGDIYRPGDGHGDGAAAALVLVPGLTRAGKDDKRLVAFANTLARAGFTVLVPDIANLRALKVKSADVRVIADAVRHLSAGLGRAGRGVPVGLAAISYAAGPAILAALRDDIRCRVGFVLAIGGYHDGVAMLTYMTTGYFRQRPGGPWRFLRRNRSAIWSALFSYADLLAEARDRDALDEMARHKLRTPDADIGDLVARLGPDGRAVHALVVNRDPDRVAGLVARLPQAIRREMAALDLKGRDFTRLAARLILIHGRDDAVIPFSESSALAAAVPAGQAALYLIDSLAHVDLGPSGIVDSVVLWRAVYRLLEARDALGAATGGAVQGCANGPPPSSARARRTSVSAASKR